MMRGCAHQNACLTASRFLQRRHNVELHEDYLRASIEVTMSTRDWNSCVEE